MGISCLSSNRGGYGYRLTAPAQRLERYEFLALEPPAGEVIVEVAGCGVCHTDVGFAFDGVLTRAPLPLTLGHEISGRIVAAGEGATKWEGRNVIVPAVIPCGRLRSLPSWPADDLPATVYAWQRRRWGVCDSRPRSRSRPLPSPRKTAARHQPRSAVCCGRCGYYPFRGDSSVWLRGG